MARIQTAGVWNPPMIDAFYVNGTSIGGSDPVHMTSWATFAAALAACTAYRDALNSWWAAMYPGDLYMDDTCIIQDNIHFDANNNPIRVGVVPNPDDHPPAAPMGAVQFDWTEVSLDWVSLGF